MGNQKRMSGLQTIAQVFCQLSWGMALHRRMECAIARGPDSLCPLGAQLAWQLDERKVYNSVQTKTVWSGGPQSAQWASNDNDFEHVQGRGHVEMQHD